MSGTIMKCGCAAQGVRIGKDGSEVPSCLTHMCIEPMPENEIPKLEGRTARCAYFGKRVFKCECDKCKKAGVCSCEVESKPSLAFFVSRPNMTHDEYYCGCFGWD